MDMFHAVGQQIDDLIGGIGDTRLFHGFRVVSEAVYNILKALRHITAGQFYGIFHLYPAGDRHDSGNDGHCNPCLPHTVHKVEEDIVVEEHLGRQILASGIHLRLQPLNIRILICRIRMHLRIAGTAHAEISVFFDKTHQIGGVRKIRKYFSVEILGNISSQSQNILDSHRLHFCKSCADTAPVSTDTGQMRYRRHIVLLLNLSCQSNGMSLGTAAGAISHAHISRLQCRDPQCCYLHISEIRTLLRRKYLKRKMRCLFY